jgi:hypothetical protein
MRKKLDKIEAQIKSKTNHKKGYKAFKVGSVYSLEETDLVELGVDVSNLKDSEFKGCKEITEEALEPLIEDRNLFILEFSDNSAK